MAPVIQIGILRLFRKLAFGQEHFQRSDLHSFLGTGDHQMSSGKTTDFRSSGFHRGNGVVIFQNRHTKVRGGNTVHTGAFVQRKDALRLTLDLQDQIHQMAAKEEHHSTIKTAQPLSVLGLVEAVHLRVNADDLTQLTLADVRQQILHKGIVAVHIASVENRLVLLQNGNQLFKLLHILSAGFFHMDMLLTNHRSCVAFCKVCSGKFVRNAPYLHIRSGKTMRFSSPTQFMAQRKSTIDVAYPGDIIGLPDTGNFKIGDTLTEGEMLHFKGLPSFSPEMFKYIENADPMKTKQLSKGIDQLMGEGVAQLFVNQFNGRKIIGTVGQLQFEVIQYRLENEYNAKCRWEPVSLYKACWIESDDAAELEAFKKRKYQFMAKDIEGRDVFLADSGYVLQMAQIDFKNIRFHFTSEF